MRAKPQFPLHTFLFAVFPVLAFLVTNLGQVEPQVALRPLALALTLALALFIVFSGLARSWRRGGLMATLALLLFFSFGQVYDFTRGVSLAGVRPFRLSTLAVVYMLLGLGGLWALWRSRGAMRNLTLLANAVSAFLVVSSLAQIGLHYARYSSLSLVAPQTGSQLEIRDRAQTPDIYYILLDSYSRADIVAGMGLDITPFLDELEGLGFTVVDCARSNYEYTEFSMAATFNMNYLQTFGSDFRENGKDFLLLEKMIQHGQVRTLLEDAGYRVVSFATGFQWAEWTDADVYLQPTQTNGLLQTLTPFEAMLLRSTAVRLLTDAPFVRARFNAQVQQVNFPYEQNVRIERYLFDQLDQVASLSGPKFVYAHVMTPHDPIIFDADGNLIEDPAFFPPPGQELPPGYFTKGATGEFEYTNKRVLKIVKDILAQSRVPPIILIQGDHGRSTQRNAILSAYYLPDGGNAQIDAHISPVNTFRVIFDTYFGTQFGRLPDISYRVSPTEAGVFSELEDPNKACR